MSPHLTVTTEIVSRVAVMTVSGHLHTGTSSELRTALHKALTDHPTAVVLDIARLTADEVTLTIFPAFAHAASSWPGCPVYLCVPQSDLRHDLRRFAVDRAVPVHPTRTAALHAAVTSPAPRRFRTVLPPTPEAPTAARELVDEACQSWRVSALTEDAEMIITELASNAVRHAGTELEVVATLRERFLHLSVRDHSARFPRMILPDLETGVGGRGLLLVDAVAASWGSMPTPGGKVVWATLRRRR